MAIHRKWLSRTLSPVGSRLALRLAVLAALLAGMPAAAVSPLPDASFTYMADSHLLPDVFVRFGRIFGLEAQLTNAVASSTAVVNGKISTANPTEFLNQIAGSYGLTWFIQNGTLHVSRSNERITRVLTPPGISATGLKMALTELGVIDPKFGWGEVVERGIVLVSGPPGYVDMVLRSVIDLPSMPPDQELQVFRLRHAPVDDRTIFYRDRQIVTPGIASILRGLISGESKTGTSIALSELASPLRGTLSPLPPINGENARAAKSEPGSVTVAPSTVSSPNRAVIQADPRLNAVIIKDRPENMQIYRQMISLLDVPSQLVEIEAMILDVNASQVAELGVDWNARAGRVSANIGNPSAPSSNPSAVISLGNANSATIISNAANFLVTRINALESKGQAKVVSRPSILTIDNQGALIDLAETFYIQSVGERVANVTPVSVGVTLKVTPHVIEEGGRKSVQLVVDIEDGTRTDVTIQGLPTIRRSNIGTQAVMAEHESLLIGGFNSESNIRQKDAVPLLADLPVVGGLFANTKSTVERKQRLFLITPRIIRPEGGDTTQSISYAVPLATQDSRTPLTSFSQAQLPPTPQESPNMRMDMQMNIALPLQTENR
ncbi:type III secretion system outer membrane ring subunit SctC [Noviherbaspirillum suwonense]|uniref:Type 3 secretion system secretin n=1 Tax=Noviherbaspirillum suwonense TaxID=1224511 RepID=A0ABY1PTB8_9BURK|nr:type III secretion system outer membrane ring subunit SctC [Noviherbaspirillum suwonense]SMP44936.1 type III secretion protein C [Noviherbaspirillum suwonense]